MSNYKKLLRNITTFIFDYDGVLTNGQVLIMPDGDQLRTANVRDGYALQLARKMGYNIAVISGGKSESMRKRFQSLNVKDVFLGVDKKLDIFHEYLLQNNLSKEEVLFMGDDIPDYHLMKEAGVATCPSDASEEIKALAKYISHCKGGEGCVRDVIEQVLKVQGKWMNHQAFEW